MTQRHSRLFGVATFILATAARGAFAATISWFPFGTLITNDADVQNSGDLYAAYAFGGSAVSATTINGVLFSPINVPASMSTTLGDATVSTPDAGATVSGQDNVFGSVSGYFSTLSADYRKLLASGVTTSPQTNAAPLHIEIDGLSIGQEYRVQLWVNDSRATFITRTESVFGGPGLLFNIGSTEGSIGQYAYGTFSADATQQLIQVQGTINTTVTQVNALAVFAVPESTTISLASVVGTLATALLRRKRTRRGDVGPSGRWQITSPHIRTRATASKRRLAHWERTQGTFWFSVG